MTYDEIDPAFGTWADIERLATMHDVLVDVMINHVSRRSAEFQDFARLGRQSRFADLFITLDKVWPNGDPPASDIATIFLRKPDAPFSTVTISNTGEPSGSGPRSAPATGRNRSISTWTRRRRAR